MRSSWKGATTFGLVNVPVKLYSATEDHDVGAHIDKAYAEVIDLMEALRQSVERNRAARKTAAKKSPAKKKAS